MENILRLGVNDTGDYYFLVTEDGSEIRFSNEGVDGSRFDGWHDRNFSDGTIGLVWETGCIMFTYTRRNAVSRIYLGAVPESERIRTWIAAVNARLPRP